MIYVNRKSNFSSPRGTEGLVLDPCTRLGSFNLVVSGYEREVGVRMRVIVLYTLYTSCGGGVVNGERIEKGVGFDSS